MCFEVIKEGIVSREQEIEKTFSVWIFPNETFARGFGGIPERSVPWVEVTTINIGGIV